MPRLAPQPLQLTGSQREQLRQIVNRHSTPQQIALRANIILLADQGYNHQQIASGLNISRDMARLWRNRWLGLSDQPISALDRLADAPRPGAPASFSLEQILQIFALACQKPSTYGRPISHWTATDLAEEASTQGIVKTISARHVGRLMDEADLKPQQSQYWLNPPPTRTLMKKSKTSAISTSMPSNEHSKENERLALTK